MTPLADGDRRVYSSARRRLLLIAGLIGIFAATLSLVLEPDPQTGLKPMPGDYLWVVIPGGLLVVVLVRRALKARIVTDGSGVDVVKVVGHDYLPWSNVRHFEVHPTPSRQGSTVMARRHDELLVKVWSQISVWPVRNRDQARQAARGRAQELRDELEADRRARMAAVNAPGAPGAAHPPPATATSSTLAPGSPGA